MVLQNKHKARVSRRYNAARGGISDSRGRGNGNGRGRGSFRGRGSNAFPSLNPDDDDDLDGEDNNEVGEGSSDEVKGKYSRRKLESNAWRYREEEVDPHADGEEESEPEVDLSGLLERVAKLDSSRTSKALSSETAARSSVQADLQDIDQSLIYLLDRQRDREKALHKDKVDTSDSTLRKARGGLSASEIKLLEMEGKRLLEERENQRRHYGRAQMLKSQGQVQSRVKSLDIGDRRREPEGQGQTTSKLKTRGKANLAALYDDDEEKGSKVEGSLDGGLDAFLQELDLDKPTSALPSALDHKDGTKQPQDSSISNGRATTSQRREHEDFLDSII